MLAGPALENLIAAIAESCRSGVDPETLRAAVLPRLRRAVPFDALWWATVDPATLLFTRAYTQEIPDDAGPYFVENEFLAEDVNKWTRLARDAVGVRTLMEATDGRPRDSPRYRDIFQPLGLEDELRAVLRTRGVSWGYLCLHRQSGSPFTVEERRLIGRVAPHLAEGIRLGVLLGAAASAEAADAPGVILLGSDASAVTANAAAERWLDELRAPSATEALPIEVHALRTQLRHLGSREAAAPRVTVLTRRGRWATLCATWLPVNGELEVAVIIQPATTTDTAPLVMRAYGLTAQERNVAEAVCRGLSTREIALRLRITSNTLQDHLKVIFDKTGVRSRRELTATILRQQYLPRAKANSPLDAAGGFS
jgi:DNA-binding CsgD family transcriptional regulator